MRWILRGLLGLAAVVVVLAAVVAARTLTYKPPGETGPPPRLAGPVAIDTARAAQHLSQAIQIQTVSHQDPAENQLGEWEKLHAWLAATYPAAHAAMTRETVAGQGLVYTWPGADPKLPPIVLMAHQDVVPVTPGSEGEWRHPPFAGTIAEGAVWGRGAIDDKGSLVALFEAAETLAAQSFKPRRTVIIVSGHDEETNGSGAQAAAALLASRGVKAQFVLDEGMLVVRDNPLTGTPTAIIGLAEKGYATLQVTAKAPGGHSSAPPKDGGGVVVLARAVTAINDAPFKPSFSGPGADMLRHLAASASPVVKMAVANTWLFEPIVVNQMSATPSGAALLHTTIAPTMLKGSPKENVLPQDASAIINYRIAPGQTSAEVMARAKSAVGDLPVSLAWVGAPKEPSPVSSTTSDAWRLLAALAADVSKAPVTPGLVTAGTDSRFLAPVAEDVYRFQPIALSLEETAMIHGTNEHMTLENLERMTQFYARLIATAAA